MKKIIFSVTIIFSILTASFAANNWKKLEYKSAPPDNPLKGLVPYADSKGTDLFPHSMEFSYLTVSSVVIAQDTYDWNVLEKFLDKTSRRGMQAIVRFYLEYPGKPSGVPDYLINEGLTLTKYERKSTQPKPPVEIQAPDYSNPALRKMMVNFIKAFGKKYDGDSRLGFITAGLLGHWGEWHSSPRNELFASKQVQIEIMNTYEDSFKITPVLLRYPAGENDPAYADNAKRNFGYHDDSFAWATLPGKDWHFVQKLADAGKYAMNKWQTNPIGGEIRPEAWGIVFDEKPENPEVQDFKTCVRITHVSWLMDSGMFKNPNPEDRQARAIKMVQGMGYEFFISQSAVNFTGPGKLTISSLVENRGVAPFYYEWTAEYALLDAKGKIIIKKNSIDNLKDLLPGIKREWEFNLDTKDIPAGVYTILLRVPNTLENGKPVGFADASQDQDLPGWLTLANGVEIVK
jgi:hypothetical protein